MARYFPEIFATNTMAAARQIILTDEGEGADTDRRWAAETPRLTGLILDALSLSERSVLVDYGCGVGRLSKALIEASDCFVVGVDISSEMRALAVQYVNSECFVALSPSQFDAIVSAGFRADAAIAVWVLQHCFEPSCDVRRIKQCLRDRGQAFVVNMRKRAVPALANLPDGKLEFFWAHDGIDVEVLLRQHFDVSDIGNASATEATDLAEDGAYWMCKARDGALEPPAG
jgi:SAM-dependent methyltransferase